MEIKRAQLRRKHDAERAFDGGDVAFRKRWK